MSVPRRLLLLVALLAVTALFGLAAGLVGAGGTRDLLVLCSAIFGLVLLMFAFLTFSEMLAPMPEKKADAAPAPTAGPAPTPSAPPTRRAA